MVRTPQRLLLVVVALVCGLTPLTAIAGLITYSESFTATGSVNGNPFSGNVLFTFTADTSQVFGNCNGVPRTFCTPNGIAGVSIQGVGSGTFNDPFYVFDNQGVAVAGFTDTALEDIVDLSNVAFASYDLKSAIGPLDTEYFFVDTGAAMGSTLGPIVIDSVSGTPVFTATTGGGTPEPSSFVLFGSGILGLSAVLRRKLKL